MLRRLSILASLLLLVGCQEYMKDARPLPSGPPSFMTEAGDKVAKASGYNEVLQTGVRETPQNPILSFAPVITLQSEALTQARADQIQAHEQYAAREVALIGQRDAWKDKYDREVQASADFRGKLSVRIAVWVERAIKTLFWTWLVMGVAGAVLSAFGGGSFFYFGKALLNLLPFANPFSFVGRLLEHKWPGVEIGKVVT